MPKSQFRADRPIVFVGLMGSGKSTVGRRLAERLALPFVDADHEIEAGAGMTVAEIFNRLGEASFREREREAMARLAAGPPKVVGAGGGAFADDSTRRLVLERCISIWLDADLDTLVGRVTGGAHRPLVNGKDEAGIRATLADLLERRSPFYAQAQYRVAVDSGPADLVVDRILTLLESPVRP